MHFYYIDESGDTGGNLDDPNQPILVLGGISVRDEGWNKTKDELSSILSIYFNGNIPGGFELHATDLLSPNGEGAFSGHPIERRTELCKKLLNLLKSRSHDVHYVALHKEKIKAGGSDLSLIFDHKHPYLLAFDYLVTYINWFVKEKLGISARAMIFLDRKDQYHKHIEAIMHDRRFGGAAAHRVKWIVEFGYPIDSKKNPMIQLSDLVIFCLKRFIEMEGGYRDNYPEYVKNFYAECYSIIKERVARAGTVERSGRNMDKLNQFISESRIEPRRQWSRHYSITPQQA